MLALILVIAGMMAVAFAIPQLVRLVRVKRSDEFSPISWWVWLGYQCVALAYSIQIHSLPFIVVNLLWAAFYLTMIILIFRYRSGPKKRRR